ncbi:MAG: heme A synthase, partial [Acidimicrobiales bacterium]
RRGRVLLGVLVAQAAIGYVQYFTGVPVLLVGAHIAGATAVWAAVVRFQLGMADRGPTAVVRPGGPGPAAETLLASA